MADRPGHLGLLTALGHYRQARRELLAILGLPESNRDPLAEFSEHLVASLIGGALAESRVQRGWDILTSEGAHVQVRYLANPSSQWVNEHLVDFRSPETDQYALVTFEDLAPTAVLIFRRATLGSLGAWLGKRHPNQDVTLQLTHRNVLRLIDARSEIADMVRVVVLPGLDA